MLSGCDSIEYHIELISKELPSEQRKPQPTAKEYNQPHQKRPRVEFEHFHGRELTERPMQIPVVGIARRQDIRVEHEAKEMLIVVFGCTLSDEDAVVVALIYLEVAGTAVGR